jgi:hypothetical protein
MFKAPLLYVFTLILWAGAGYAQDKSNTSVSYESGTNLNVLYRSDFSGKFFANTRGLGFALRRGRHVTAKTRSFYEGEIQGLKHPKEIKLEGAGPDRKRFVYGKVNTVLLLRAAFGLQNIIFGKGDGKAVEVRYSYSIGPTLGLAKPYYIKVYKTGISDLPETVFDESIMGNRTQVLGRAPFSRGLDQIKIYPGGTAKFNLSFEYAPYTNLIRAIETGVSLDYFPKALPIMAMNPAENFVVTLHVGFVFGRKWF